MVPGGMERAGGEVNDRLGLGKIVDRLVGALEE